MPQRKRLLAQCSASVLMIDKKISQQIGAYAFRRALPEKFHSFGIQSFRFRAIHDLAARPQES